MLTGTDKAAHSCHCPLSYPRLRKHAFVQTAARPPRTRAHRHSRASFSSQTTDPASLNQLDSRSKEEARNGTHRDNSELNQLARMMPDPAEDELFDDRDPNEFSNADDRQLIQRQGLSSNLLLDNNDYSDAYEQDYGQGFADPQDYAFDDANLADEGFDDEPDLFAIDMTQLDYHVEAKRRWEKRKAETRAFELFHSQGTNELNIYAQTHALAQIMSDIEAQDKLEGRGPVPVPAWIRAHFRLDECWDQFAEFMRETENRVAMPPASVEDSPEKSIEDEARQLLAEGDFFQSAPVLETSPAARMPLQGVAADADQDDDLDQFLAPLPGADTETDMVNRLMSPDRDEEDTDDS